MEYLISLYFWVILAWPFGSDLLLAFFRMVSEPVQIGIAVSAAVIAASSARFWTIFVFPILGAIASIVAAGMRTGISERVLTIALAQFCVLLILSLLVKAISFAVARIVRT